MRGGAEFADIGVQVAEAVDFEVEVFGDCGRDTVGDGVGDAVGDAVGDTGRGTGRALHLSGTMNGTTPMSLRTHH